MLNRPSPSFSDASAKAQTLCRLMDSDVSADEVESACAAWRADSALRGNWHDWQLIGDVMRSGDLALPPAHDEQFLHSLRDRLAAEPIQRRRRVAARGGSGAAGPMSSSAAR